MVLGGESREAADVTRPVLERQDAMPMRWRWMRSKDSDQHRAAREQQSALAAQSREEPEPLLLAPEHDSGCTLMYWAGRVVDGICRVLVVTASGTTERVAQPDVGESAEISPSGCRGGSRRKLTVLRRRVLGQDVPAGCPS